jgi:hypothetical protein
MAVVAATAFITATSAAHADTVAAGTWDARITGGTLSLGDGDLQSMSVPAGDGFTFTVPAGTSAPVAFRAPAMHIPIPVHTAPGDLGTWVTSGSLDVSPIAGTVNPATGAVAGTATAHGLLRLDVTSAGGTTSIYCQLGDEPPPPESPAPPSPFALGFAGTLASGTLRDATFALQLNCGAPFITPATDLAIVGHPVMPAGANLLTLTAAFTRRPDPAPPAATPKVTVTPPPVVAAKCVVPKLRGLTLKKARKAAAKANCAVGKVKRKRSARKARTVLKQGARAGRVLKHGSRITLTVAR